MMLDLFPSRDAGRFGRRLKRARGARIPVTVVTGFLGAGKTTLVRRFLATPEGAGTAVVINEFRSVGIEDALVRASSDDVTRAAQSRRRARARHAAAVQADIDRNQRTRRSGTDPADLRHRSGAGRRIPRRGGRRRGRRRGRPRHAQMVGGSANQGGASGSTGIQMGGKQMRMAAAEARRVLVEMAAAKLALPADALTVTDGVVHAKGDASKRASYAELIGGRYFNVELDWNKKLDNALYAPGKAKPKDPKDYKIVGQPIAREDIAPKVYAQEDFCTDVRRPG